MPPAAIVRSVLIRRAITVIAIVIIKIIAAIVIPVIVAVVIIIEAASLSAISKAFGLALILSRSPVVRLVGTLHRSV